VKTGNVLRIMAALAVMAGCGLGPEDPPDVLHPKVGRYSYDDGTYRGTITISNVRPDPFSSDTTPRFDMLFEIVGLAFTPVRGPWWSIDRFVVAVRQLFGEWDLQLRVSWIRTDVTCEQRLITGRPGIAVQAHGELQANCSMRYLGR
jgi:hypothetical protein